MHPPYEKGRYITLLGHPIGPKGPKPLATSFHERTEFKAGGVAVALTALFNDVALNATPEQTTEAIIDTGIHNLMHCTVLPFVEKIALLNGTFSPQDLAEKCIDTRPDRNTVSTLDRHGLPAHIAKLKYAAWGGVVVCLDTAFSAFRVAAGRNPLPALMMSASYYARLYSGYNRFNKVAKGEWVIVDMPEPEKQRETNPILIPAVTR